MSENVVKSLSENTQNFLAPIHNINQVAVNNLSKVTEIQLSSAKYFADLGINQMKQAASVNDLDSARDFAARSLALMGEINKRIMEDGQVLANLGNEFNADIGSILGEIASTQPVKPAKKAAAKS